ncbi:hypothetical protein BHE74_00012983 [Ensete ventricosum]|nr:hypothetical protein BHE74_00012983 [Ensete ventricosum]
MLETIWCRDANVVSTLEDTSSVIDSSWLSTTSNGGESGTDSPSLPPPSLGLGATYQGSAPFVPPPTPLPKSMRIVVTDSTTESQSIGTISSLPKVHENRGDRFHDGVPIDWDNLITS